MKIERFETKDIHPAIDLVKQAWHSFYDGFSEEYIGRIAECIIRHNYTDADLAFKITDNGEIKGVILGTRKGRIVNLSNWVRKQLPAMSGKEKEWFERLNHYMDEADRNTLAEMTDTDAKLSLFVSRQKGCGRQLLQAITQEFKGKGFERVFLWTDTSCDHDYYPTHGFTLASEYRDRHYSLPDMDYMTYIYWKPIE